MDCFPILDGDGKPIDLRMSIAGGSTIDDTNHDQLPAKNIPFEVVSCSGEDQDFPASELNKGLLGRGWQSSRFCCFPQEIVLKLQQPSRIINMQLLCHEYKISSRVEVFVSLMMPYVHSDEAVCQMKRLGYLSLDPNERSEHQARELKSIYVDSRAAVIRLVLHNCYTNKLNLYNQVGLVALLITGEPLEGQHLEHLNQHGVAVSAHFPRIQVTSATVVDARIQVPSPTAGDVDLKELDSATASHIRRLLQEKELAVLNEDYDEAKRLKKMTETLKVLGQQIKHFECQKHAAVQVEDYDTAKHCKIKIEKLMKLSDQGPLEAGQLDKQSIPDKSEELGFYGALSEDGSQEGTGSEGNLSSTSWGTVRREAGTQTLEEKNTAVNLVGEYAISSTSSGYESTISNSMPDYSSFKIRPGDLTGLSNDANKQAEKVSGIFTWWRGQTVLKPTELSPPPSVRQPGPLNPVVTAANMVSALTSELLPPMPTASPNANDVPEVSSSLLSTYTNQKEPTSPVYSNPQESPYSSTGVPSIPLTSQQASLPAATAIFNANEKPTFYLTMGLSCLDQKEPLPTDLPYSATIPSQSGSSPTSQKALPDGHPDLLVPVAKRFSNHNEPPALTTTGTQVSHRMDYPSLPPSLANHYGSSATRPTPGPTVVGQNESLVKLLKPVMLPDLVIQDAQPANLSAVVQSYSKVKETAGKAFSTSPAFPSEGRPMVLLPSVKPNIYGHNGVLPIGLSEDVLTPEPLTESVKTEAGPLLALVDLFHVECLYSKQWQLREKAVQIMIDEVRARSFVEDPASSFRVLNKVLLRTLNDRSANVYNSALQLLKSFVTTYSMMVSNRELQIVSSGFANILLEKLADSNIRTKEVSSEALMFLASRKEIGLHPISGPLLKPIKNQGIWRPVLGRLHLLLTALPQYGVQPPGCTGFPSELLMTFVRQAFSSPSGDVRNAAVKVTTEVYRLMGPSVEKYLKGLKPLIREVLTVNFDRVAHEVELEDEYQLKEEIPSLDKRVRPNKRGQDTGLHSLAYGQNTEFVTGEDRTHRNLCSPGKSEQAPSSTKQSVQELKFEKEREPPEHQQVSPNRIRVSTESYDATTTSILQEMVHSQVESQREDIRYHVKNPSVNCASQQSHYSDEEASLNSSSHPPQKEGDDSSIDKDETADSCLFCGKQDNRFLEGDNLDLHFCQKCPMLASCSNCGQIVEISSLKDHHLFECMSAKRGEYNTIPFNNWCDKSTELNKGSTGFLSPKVSLFLPSDARHLLSSQRLTIPLRYVECQKCYLAVPETRLAAHQKSKDCRRCKQHKLVRCPLCFHTVEPGDTGWREHILKQPGCLRNPRTLIHAS